MNKVRIIASITPESKCCLVIDDEEILPKIREEISSRFINESVFILTDSQRLNSPSSKPSHNRNHTSEESDQKHGEKVYLVDNRELLIIFMYQILR